MAALLCEGIGKACTACCECIGTVCKLPFKICGSCCDALGQCCNESCRLLTDCCQSSFCCYITVTCALNIPPIVVGLSDIPNAAGGCSGSLWLLIFWMFCLVHIVAAFYMSHAIEKDDSILPSPRDEEHGGLKIFQKRAEGGAGRMSNLFCYDGWMAVYILVVIGYIGWLTLGGVWFATGTMDHAHECDESIALRFEIAFGFGWAFVFLGGFGLCCSVCCGIFSGPRHRNSR